VKIPNEFNAHTTPIRGRCSRLREALPMLFVES
jgi:hypothetical protein